MGSKRQVSSMNDAALNPTLPADFVERLRQTIDPQDWEEVWASFEGSKPAYARVNGLLGSVAQVLEDPEVRDLGPSIIDSMPWTLRFDPAVRDKLTRTQAASDGRLYLQRLSSQLAAPLLNPQPGETVLDLAAAPGGKTLHLAALMENEGRLSAVEPIKPRMYRLADNLKRGGVTIARTYLMDGRKVGRKTPDRFDRVLLDAPCSSEARIRRDQPESYQFWSARKIKEQSRKQRGLLVAALQATRPGGRVVYCTCSFAPEENEAVVQHALEAFEGEARLLAFDVPEVKSREGLTAWQGEAWDERLALTRRVLPSAETDGFFLALLERES
jgi:16S rRNA C967 or C1407 C5-methylase (RsmB/RsmF family)